jgi:hypothetical protein
MQPDGADRFLEEGEVEGSAAWRLILNSRPMRAQTPTGHKIR